MKRIMLIVLAAFLMWPNIGARCLIITLLDGQRLAFELDNQDVVMKHNNSQLTFNGYSIGANIKEFRIHARRPQDAIAVGITSVQSTPKDEMHTIHDLSGRHVKQLRPGIYIINRKKIVIR